jgi:5-methylcytosine-specific restriction endonuclease McrA
MCSKPFAADGLTGTSYNRRQFCSLKCAYKFREGKPSGAKGKTWKLKPETIKKHTELFKRISKEQKNIDHIRAVGKSFAGKKKPERSGELHWNWQGGKTSENVRLRKSLEYKLWRDAVFKRDNYTCVWCFSRGARLVADHIKRWSDYPELRFAIDNGRTLCRSCHEKTDTYGGKRHE